MPCVIKQSLGFIRKMRNDDLTHRFKHEEDFISKFVENYQSCPNLVVTNSNDRFKNIRLYNNLYDSFVTLFEIQILLDQIEYDGLTCNRANELIELCNCILPAISTDVMLSLDEELSFFKKYSLADDLFVFVKTFFLDIFISFYGDKINTILQKKETLELSKFDFVLFQMTCKRIRTGLSIIRLFLLLALFQISPFYSPGVATISKKMMILLREMLYNKRIVKIGVDVDTHGGDSKKHRTTRLAIVFALNNDDCYNLRLDFPHNGEDSIHLNINEPGIKQSTGLPFSNERYKVAAEICKDEDVFNKLFYKFDDLYWFRSNFLEVVKEIKKSDISKGKQLESFRHEQAHCLISSSDSENRDLVSSFSIALAEALEQLENVSVYVNTSYIDEKYFLYERFQDYLFELVVKRWLCDMEFQLEDPKNKNENEIQLRNLEISAREKICDYIYTKFPEDEDLKKCASCEDEFSGFLSKCFDIINNKIVYS